MPNAETASGLPDNVTRTAVTVGTFDGVHLGHQDVLQRLVTRARTLGVPSLLVTFDPHPLEVVNPAAAPPLLSVGNERLEVLAESGVDYVVVIPFTHVLANFTPEQFVDRVLLDRLRMHDLLMGHDHGLGRNRAGDVDALRRIGIARGFDVQVVPAVTTSAGQPISSTAIRRAVAGGDLERAALALGRPYSVGGRVVPGVSQGRALGYPTVNLESPPPRKLLPPQGVYAVRVQTPFGPFGGMMNLGPRPTFGDAKVGLEAHLFNAAHDLYDSWVRIDFLRRLRDTQKFADAAALRAQLAKDADAAQEILAATA